MGRVNGISKQPEGWGKGGRRAEESQKAYSAPGV